MKVIIHTILILTIFVSQAWASLDGEGGEISSGNTVHLSEKHSQLFTSLFKSESSVAERVFQPLAYILNIFKTEESEQESFNIMVESVCNSPMHSNPEEPLLQIPRDARLLTMLDTFEDLSTHAFQLNIDKFGRNRLIIFLKVLSESPELIPHVIFLNYYGFGIDNFLLTQPGEEGYKKDCETVLRFTKCLGSIDNKENTKLVLTLLTNHIHGVLEIPKARSLIGAHLYMSFFEALKERSKDLHVRLLHRTFELMSPKELTDYIYGGVVGKRIEYENLSSFVGSVLNRIEKTVGHLSEAEFDKLVAYLKSRNPSPNLGLYMMFNDEFKSVIEYKSWENVDVGLS